MAKKKKKTIQLFTFSSELRSDFQKLYTRSVADMNDSDREIFISICSQCAETGKISLGQLRVVGRIYKQYLQDGEYVHHNWKIWGKKSMKASA